MKQWGRVHAKALRCMYAGAAEALGAGSVAGEGIERKWVRLVPGPTPWGHVAGTEKPGSEHHLTKV